jgi:5-methylcytosine-specific restriction enzyme subunit McrC
MVDAAALADAYRERGPLGFQHKHRLILKGREHEPVDLPNDLVRPDGTLDLYSDVQKLLSPVFIRGRPAIRCQGWVGYIPLNDKYALEVETRVPVHNLERLILASGDYSPKVLAYVRKFGLAEQQPLGITRVLEQAFVSSVERLTQKGLLHVYVQEKVVSAMPKGRLHPRESALRTLRSGRPTAASTSFVRTADCPPNRVIKAALDRVAGRPMPPGLGRFEHRLRRLISLFAGVSRPRREDLKATSTAAAIRHLPSYHEDYIDALIFAQIINSGLGVAIRDDKGGGILPSMLIDMSTVFENYVRKLLGRRNEDATVSVRNGNVEGADGAKVKMFTDRPAERSNPPATPDIVIVGNTLKTPVIIDAKYKPLKDLPDREDLNQIVTYGVRFDSTCIMIACPGASAVSVEHIGSIGNRRVFIARIDLGAEDLDAEEGRFAQGVLEVAAS